MENDNTITAEETGWVILSPKPKILTWTFGLIKSEAIEILTAHVSMSWEECEEEGYKAVEAERVITVISN